MKFQDVAIDQNATAEAAQPRPAREMRINREDLEEHGYDGECTQCKHILKYGKTKRGQQHSAQCRQRIVEAMGKTEAGKRRLEINEERITRTMAEQLELQMKRRALLHARPSQEEMVTGTEGSLKDPAKEMARQRLRALLRLD